MKSMTKTQLVIAVDEEHEMKFRITHKTKFAADDKQGGHEIKPASLEPGQALAVDAQTSLDGAFEAVRVVLELPASP
jgi:hypothetical protein